MGFRVGVILFFVWDFFFNRILDKKEKKIIVFNKFRI